MLLHKTFIPWQAYTSRHDNSLCIYYGLELQPEGGFVVIGTETLTTVYEDGFDDPTAGKTLNDLTKEYVRTGGLEKAQVFFSILAAIASWEADPVAQAAASAAVSWRLKSTAKQATS